MHFGCTEPTAMLGSAPRCPQGFPLVPTGHREKRPPLSSCRHKAMMESKGGEAPELRLFAMGCMVGCMTCSVASLTYCPETPFRKRRRLVIDLHRHQTQVCLPQRKQERALLTNSRVSAAVLHFAWHRSAKQPMPGSKQPWKLSLLL